METSKCKLILHHRRQDSAVGWRGAVVLRGHGHGGLRVKVPERKKMMAV